MEICFQVIIIINNNFICILNYFYFNYYYYYIKGTVPSTLCSITSLTNINVAYSGTNTGITCAPQCLTTVTTRILSSTYCPTFQDDALCGFIAATNINAISGYSQWSCTTLGVTTTNPCNTSSWSGLACLNGYVGSITINGIGISGKLCI